MPSPKEQIYTIDDIYNLPDGQRAELIHRQIYDIAPMILTFDQTIQVGIYSDLQITVSELIK